MSKGLRTATWAAQKQHERALLTTRCGLCDAPAVGIIHGITARGMRYTGVCATHAEGAKRRGYTVESTSTN